jgi:hypothetical protein
MKCKLVIFYCFGCIILMLLSCGEVLQDAQKRDPVNAKSASSFVSVAGDSSISLYWTLPSFEDFTKVVLLRKTGTYPISYSDPAASNIYEGMDSSYTDTSVSVGILYCYSLYSVNVRGAYTNNPPKTQKSLVEGFTATVRNRCFYLIGGSSDWADPFNHLVSAVDAFDPETDPPTIYLNIATIPIPRYSCATASANGKIFVFGGLDYYKNIVADVDVLDASSSTWPAGVWSKATNMPTPRFSLRAENIDGRIFVFGGSKKISPVPWSSMTDYNHRFNPFFYTWNADESQVPRLQNSLMNFVSGAYSGHLIYGTGRNNYSYAFTANLYRHNMEGNFNTAAADPVTARASAAGVMYSKPISGDVDLAAFFIIGGCTDNNTNFEPLRSITGGFLAATNMWSYQKMPVTGAPVSMGANVLKKARAYAEAESYVRSDNKGFLYIFSGIQGGGSNTVLDSYEWIEVDNGLTFPVGWAEVSGLTPRFAFDITKVNL